MSIRPPLEQIKEHGPKVPSQAEKRARAGPATMAPEALVIHTLTSAEPPRPRPEATGDVEQVSLKEERPEYTVQLGQDITTLDLSLIHI